MAKFNHIYLCPALLTEMGHDLTGLSANAVWRMIWSVSALIDTMTAQWFNGDYDEWLMDGFGQRLIEHPSKIPFIAVDSIQLNTARTNYDRHPIPLPTRNGYFPPYVDPQSGASMQTLEPTSYHVHKRHLETVFGAFPAGPKNITVSGALGWVARNKDVRTTTTSDVEADTTEVELTSVAGISAWDVVDLFDSDGEGVRVMVTAVDRTANTLTIDPPSYMDYTLAAGATAYCFGAPPLPIGDLASFLFSKALRMREANENGQVPMDDARIRRERTDDYEYELFGASATSTGMALVTGNLLMETILRDFSRPGGLSVI